MVMNGKITDCYRVIYVELEPIRFYWIINSLWKCLYLTHHKGALFDTVLFRLWDKEGEEKYMRNSVNIGDSANEMIL